MKDKERVLAFLQKLIPDNFSCGHVSVTFNDDGSLFISVSNAEVADDNTGSGSGEA